MAHATSLAATSRHNTQLRLPPAAQQQQQQGQQRLSPRTSPIGSLSFHNQVYPTGEGAPYDITLDGAEAYNLQDGGGAPLRMQQQQHHSRPIYNNPHAPSHEHHPHAPSREHVDFGTTSNTSDLVYDSTPHQQGGGEGGGMLYNNDRSSSHESVGIGIEDTRGTNHHHPSQVVSSSYPQLNEDGTSYYNNNNNNNNLRGSNLHHNQQSLNKHSRNSNPQSGNLYSNRGDNRVSGGQGFLGGEITVPEQHQQQLVVGGMGNGRSSSRESGGGGQQQQQQQQWSNNGNSHLLNDSSNHSSSVLAHNNLSLHPPPTTSMTHNTTSIHSSSSSSSSSHNIILIHPSLLTLDMRSYRKLEDAIVETKIFLENVKDLAMEKGLYAEGGGGGGYHQGGVNNGEGLDGSSSRFRLFCTIVTGESGVSSIIHHTMILVPYCVCACSREWSGLCVCICYKNSHLKVLFLCFSIHRVDQSFEQCCKRYFVIVRYTLLMITVGIRFRWMR